MVLPSSGGISIDQIHVEAGGASGTTCSLNDADIRGIVRKTQASTIDFNEFRGKSFVPGPSVLLDASFTESWPGSGTTWYDVSGNGRHGSWNAVSTGTYNGKTYFSTNNGSYRCTGSPANSLGITNTSGFTIFMVYRVTAASGNFAIFFNGTTGREISGHIPWGDGTIYFDQGGCCDAAQRTQWTISPTNTVYNYWHSVALVRTTGATNSRHIYYDGSLVATNTTTGANLNFNGDAISYVNQTVNWPAHVMTVAIYNRGLTTSEIQELHSRYHPG